MFPKSTNETFATKLFQQYRNHKRLSKPKLGRTDFTINHYAGDVSIRPTRVFFFDIVACLLACLLKARFNCHPQLNMDTQLLTSVVELLTTAVTIRI